MMRALLVIVLAALARGRAAAAEPLAGGLEWTRIPVSVRQQSAGAQAAHDPLSAFANPALSALQATVWQVGLSDQIIYWGDQSVRAIACGWSGHPGANGVSGAAFVSSLAAKSFAVTGLDGVETGDTISPGGLHAGLAAAYRWKSFAFGAGGRFARESFGGWTDPVSSVQIDAGLAAAGARFEGGVAFRGLVATGTGSPQSLLVGGAWQAGRFGIGAQAEYGMNTDGNRLANTAGLRFTVGGTVRVARFLQFRAGLETPLSSAAVEGPAIRPGLTLGWGAWSLDYAASTELGGGLAHLIAVGWASGAATAGPAKPEPKAVVEPTLKLAEGSRTLAVAQFDPQNVSAGDAAVIADLFRVELVRAGDFDVVEKGSMEKVLQEQAFQQTGCTTQECAVKLGKILNVRYLVVGSFGKLIDEYVLSIRLIEVETAKVIYSDAEQGANVLQIREALAKVGHRLTTALGK